MPRGTPARDPRPGKVSAALRKPPVAGAGRLVTMELPEGLLNGIDEQIEAGEYSSRDDFVKEAVRDKLRDLRRG